MIDTIIFDLGGVLIDWNPKYLFREYFETDEALDHFLTVVCTYEWNLEQDAGRTWQKATDELILQFPQYSNEILAYWKKWPKMLGQELASTVAVLKNLVEKPQYRVVALTNWSAETFPFAQARFEFLEWFDGILVSGEEGMRKPNLEIYQLLLERFSIDPEHSIFIDDSLSNIEAGIQMGIAGIHFTPKIDLVQELRNKGVTV